MERKKTYLTTVIPLYLNYFVHGMGLIILSQNKLALSEQFNSDVSGLAYVISAFGIGRIAVLYISGVLSDRYGRKPFIVLGGVLYILFFLGILISPNISTAFIFALCAGIANSFFDASTYPALMEMFPRAKGTASVLIKAFISSGQFVLTSAVAFIVANGLYFGYSFLACAVILGINVFLVSRSSFPKPVTQDTDTAEVEKVDDVTSEAVALQQAKPEPVLKTGFSGRKPIFWFEGVAVILIGFTCSTTFDIAMIWLPSFGENVVHMDSQASLYLISFYTVGSVSAVLISAAVVDRLVRPVRILFFYPLASVLSMIALLIFPSPVMSQIISFAIGFSAAGGVLQLTVPVLVSFFPRNKGKLTGLVYSASSVAAFVAPVGTGMLYRGDNLSGSLVNIFLFNIIVTGCGVVLGLIVNIRYNMVLGKRSPSEKQDDRADKVTDITEKDESAVTAEKTGNIPKE